MTLLSKEMSKAELCSHIYHKVIPNHWVVRHSLVTIIFSLHVFADKSLCCASFRRSPFNKHVFAHLENPVESEQKLPTSDWIPYHVGVRTLNAEHMLRKTYTIQSRCIL